MPMTVTKPAAEMRLIRADGHETAAPIADLHVGQDRWMSHHKLIWRDAEGLLWQCGYSKGLTELQGQQPWEDEKTVQSVRAIPRSRAIVEFVKVDSTRDGDVCLTPAGGPHVWRYEVLSGPIGLPAIMQVRKTLVGPVGGGVSYDSASMDLDEWAALGGDYYTRGAAPIGVARTVTVVAVPVHTAPNGEMFVKAPQAALDAVVEEYGKQARLFGVEDKSPEAAERLMQWALPLLLAAKGSDHVPGVLTAYSTVYDEPSMARLRKILDKHGKSPKALLRIAAALLVSALAAVP